MISLLSTFQRLVLFLSTAGLLSLAQASAAGLGNQTVVLYNDAVPESKALAEFYAQARSIPTDNLVAVTAEKGEVVTREQFRTQIESPLRLKFVNSGWFSMANVKDQGMTAVEANKRYLAIMYGVPLKVAEDLPPPGPVDPKTGKPTPPNQPAAGSQNCSSVDAELALLGFVRKPIAGFVQNPVFKKATAWKETPPSMLAVGRIDGPSIDHCKRMITEAIEVEKTGLWGRVYLDLARKGGSYDEGDQWLLLAGKAFGGRGWPVVIDGWPQTLPQNYPMTEAAVYLGWYTRSVDGPFLNPAFKFKKGAIACHLHSYSALTLRTDAAEWCGPLIARGACAVMGNTWEPYLTLTVHFDVFSERILEGATFAEAHWLAVPALSWMNVAIGDPLYRPFAAINDEKPSGPDADYQIYHSAIRRLSFDKNREPMMKELEKAATERKSGTLWESLGLATQSYFPDDMKRAAGYFEKAANTYTAPADQIRSYLQVPDMERRNDKIDGAVADLKAIIAKYPNVPEAKAAEFWLNTLRPPPPAPPPPPSKESKPAQKKK